MQNFECSEARLGGASKTTNFNDISKENAMKFKQIVLSSLVVCMVFTAMLAIIGPDVQAGLTVNNSKKLWPYATVPFMISDLFPSEQRQIIKDAIKEVRKATEPVLKFVHIDEPNRAKYWIGKKNYILFVPRPAWSFAVSGCGGGASSHVGMKGGVQTIKVGFNFTDSILSCTPVGKATIMHEILHALGLYHEHQRIDHFRNVKINVSNINCSNKSDCLSYILVNWGMNNFAKLNGPYDCDSIMHYTSTGGAKPGKKIIKGLPGKCRTKKIGRGTKLSSGDIRTIKTLYSWEFSRRIMVKGSMEGDSLLLAERGEPAPTSTENAPSVLGVKSTALSMSGNRFELHVNGLGIESIQVQVFSLGGELLIEESSSGNQLSFTALTRNGRSLANGVYLYMVTVRGGNSQILQGKLKKLVILR